MNLRAVVQGTTVQNLSMTSSMDALGLSLLSATTAGLRIIAAGNCINAPSDATLAIVCIAPNTADSGGSLNVAIQEQVYVVSKGNECNYTTGNNGMGSNTWRWGATDVYGSVIYLG